MGLDMFLHLKCYESKFKKEKDDGNFYPDELSKIYSKVKNHLGFAFKETKYAVGYWRNAHAIHDWFVKHCAYGKDDCKEIDITKAQLMELRRTCKRVLNDRDSASDLLPDDYLMYNEYYYQLLEYTVELITDVLYVIQKTGTKYDVAYRASW
jgi:hypothetical protein